MAVFAPVIIQLAWLPLCLDLHILGQFCQSFLWWLVFSTSYPRLNPLELEVVAVVISIWWSHWWFYLGDFALVISRSIIIIDHTLENPLVSPIFSCGTLQFHATLFLSFLTMVSFLTTTSISTTALGPLLDAPDRCVGFLAWSCWEGDRTVRQEIASFPPRCATTPFGSGPPTTLIQSSRSSKFCGEGGSDESPLLPVLLPQIHCQ